MKESVSVAVCSAIRCIYLKLYQSGTELQETFSLLTLMILWLHVWVCMSLCVSVHVHGHVRCIIYWMFLRHNIFIQLHLIQPYSKSSQSRGQYSTVYFGTAVKCVCFHCICPSSWFTTLMEQQFFVWSCHRRWVMKFGENTLLLYTQVHTLELTSDCAHVVCTHDSLCHTLCNPSSADFISRPIKSIMTYYNTLMLLSQTKKLNSQTVKQFSNHRMCVDNIAKIVNVIMSHNFFFLSSVVPPYTYRCIILTVDLN